MKDSYSYIDELVKDSLEGIQEEAGKEVWEKLRWSLFWMRYRWYIGLSSVLILVGVASVVSSYPLQNIPDHTQTNDLLNGQSTVLLAYNQSIESHAYFSEIKTEHGDVEQQNPSLHSLNSTSNADQMKNSTDNNLISSNDYVSDELVLDHDLVSLSEIALLHYPIHLSLVPDTTLFGYNRQIMGVFKPIQQTGFSVSIYAGPSWPTAQISGLSSEYLGIRKANESSSLGWSIGSDIRFHFKNWVLTTGVSYAVYNQKRSYSHIYQEYSEEVSYYQYDTSWVYVYDAPEYGVPMMTGVDSTWVKVYNDVTVDNSGINQVRYFEVPLLIGYSLHTNAFTMEFNAGASLGWLTYSRVKLPGLSNYNEMEEVDQQINNTMVNVVANATLYYHLNRKTSLFVSPYYKQNMHSMFQNNFDQKQQFKTIGINFGINIVF